MSTTPVRISSRTPQACSGPKRDYHILAQKLIGKELAIDSYSLHLSSLIGVGAFGVILLADEYDGCVPTRRQFAVKCLLRGQPNSSADAFVLREKNLHVGVRPHPHVVQVHAVIEQFNVIYLVMDYYPAGDLFQCIVERQEFVGRDDLVREAFLQVAHAVQSCHESGVFHRDIKPENILVRPGALPELALADFGLATQDEVSTEFGVGSSYYMSLECGGNVNKHGVWQSVYSPRSNDIWSLGVLLVNLACGRNPWARAHLQEETFACYMRDPDYLTKILPITPQLNELLKGVFQTGFNDRCSIQDLIDGVRRIDRFTLDWNELCGASEVVRQAAGPLLEVRRDQANYQVASHTVTANHYEEEDGIEWKPAGSNSWNVLVDTIPSPLIVDGACTTPNCEVCLPSNTYNAEFFKAVASTYQPPPQTLGSPYIEHIQGFQSVAPSSSPALRHVVNDSPGLASDCGSLPSTPGGMGPRTPGTRYASAEYQDSTKRPAVTEADLLGRYSLGLYQLDARGQVDDVLSGARMTIAAAAPAKAPGRWVQPPDAYFSMFGGAPAAYPHPRAS